MRAIATLLLTTLMASSAYAQMNPNAAAVPGSASNGAAPATGSASAMPAMVNGKFVVGYEGRGDYLKNEQLAKQSTTNPGKVATSTELADELAKEQAPGDAKATAAAPAAAPVPVQQQAAAQPQPEPQAQTGSAESRLRSDSGLRNDGPKPSAQVAPSATTTASNAAPAPSPGAPNYNPMVLIGGRIQR